MLFAKAKKYIEKKDEWFLRVGKYRGGVEYKGAVQGYFRDDKTVLYGAVVVDT